MEYAESTVPSAEGTGLFAREWKAEQPRMAVCLIHGMGDHSGRYGNVGTRFTEAGISVVAADLRGHGRSFGKRGHVFSYEEWLEDVESALTATIERYPGLPVILYGHSMGGNLVLNYAIRRKPEIAGLIAASPWIRLVFAPPKWKERLGRWMNRIAPAVRQRTGLKPHILARDTEQVLESGKDQLLHDFITPRAYYEVSDAGEWVLAHADELAIPLLLMHGTADQVTSIEASERFAEKAEAHCTFMPWKGYYHELHNDLQYDEALSYIISWMGMLTGLRDIGMSEDSAG